MERTFLIFEFQGIYINKCNGRELKKMSLADCLKRVYNTYYDNGTKRLFNCYNLEFTRHELTVDQINKKVSEGWALFPISERQDIKEVKKYIELGLVPVFIKCNDLRALRKVYG